MKLRTYMAEKKITSKYLAEHLGVSRGYINHLRLGFVRCSKRLAKQICIITNNEVTEKELLDEYDLRQSEKKEKNEGKEQDEAKL